MTRGCQPIDPIIRLGRKCEPGPGGCMNWTGCVDSSGYGKIHIGSISDGTNRRVRVHRLAASIWLGFDLDSPLCVLHRCDNKLCFNPAHLFVGTVADNNADCWSKGRAFCPNGERNRRRKLTVSLVMAIRSSVESTKALASKLGVNVDTIRRARLGESWKEGYTWTGRGRRETSAGRWKGRRLG
jgi:hypothetical protein